MSYPYRRGPLARRDRVVDAAQARAAIARVATERDALASQLDEARARITELERAATRHQAELEQAAARHQGELEAMAEREATTAALAGRAERLAADLANVRRHRDEAIERGIRSESGRLLTELVSVRDTVSRALASDSATQGPWHDGLMAIRAMLDTVLSREGATLLGHSGERFDPELHRAVGTAAGSEPDQVHEVVSSGLMLADGVVVQPASVIVTA